MVEVEKNYCSFSLKKIDVETFKNERQPSAQGVSYTHEIHVHALRTILRMQGAIIRIMRRRTAN